MSWLIKHGVANNNNIGTATEADSTGDLERTEILEFHVSCPKEVTWKMRVNETCFVGSKNLEQYKRLRIIANLNLCDDDQTKAPEREIPNERGDEGRRTPTAEELTYIPGRKRNRTDQGNE